MPKIGSLVVGITGSWNGEWHTLDISTTGSYKVIIAAVSYTGNGSINAGGGVFSIACCLDGTIRVARIVLVGTEDWPTTNFISEGGKLKVRGIAAWTGLFVWY